MTDIESWKGYIRCFSCHERLKQEDIFMFNDLLVCHKCFKFLHEQKKKKLPHPMETMDHKHFIDDNFKEKPSKKKGKNK